MQKVVRPAWFLEPAILKLGRWRQEDQYFKARFGYRPIQGQPELHESLFKKKKIEKGNVFYI